MRWTSGTASCAMRHMFDINAENHFEGRVMLKIIVALLAIVAGTNAAFAEFSSAGEGRKSTVKRYGGSNRTEAAIDNALLWLARHQESDGHWDSLKHGATKKEDTLVTSLALITFLGAGHSEKVGKYRDNLRSAIVWLKSNQNEKGLIFDKTDANPESPEESAAAATYALSFAAAMARVPETRDAAQKGIDYCVAFLHSAWNKAQGGHDSQPKGPPDTTSTMWYALALRTAKFAEMKTDKLTFDGISAYLEKIKKDDEFVKKASRFPRYDGNVPDKLSTAAALYTRELLGAKTNDLEASVTLLIEEVGVPKWDGDNQNLDLYIWYLGTNLAFQQAGQTWKTWNAAMKTALLPNQIKTGDNSGSWDAGAKAHLGRIGTTVLACLCLEIYFRYPRFAYVDPPYIAEDTENAP
jgi:hypothetical protein